MSVYGLDFIKINDSEYFLIEINGITSGMKGYDELYGTDTAADINKLINPHHKEIINFFESVKKKKSFFLKSKKSEKHNEMKIKFCLSYFPWDLRYYMNDIVVYNWSNSPIIHDLMSVNPYVNEEITRNKFMQHLLLKDTSVKKIMPESTLVGLGFCDYITLNRLIDSNYQLVKKPLLNNMGSNVEFINSNHARKYFIEQGGVWPENGIQGIIGKIFRNPDLISYFQKSDSLFEKGLSLLQEPKKITDNLLIKYGGYNSIRLLVCNGKSIKSYMRIANNRIVNLSQSAKPVPYGSEKLDDLAEEVVSVFENKCKSLDRNNFRRELYGQYFEEVNHRNKN
ncbi:MAG: hypothetical protein KKF65_03450 [Nanoarchaeota archaeon]|nr:hypothetical protein [Nanoarchaeota archaeon]